MTYDILNRHTYTHAHIHTYTHICIDPMKFQLKFTLQIAPTFDVKLLDPEYPPGTPGAAKKDVNDALQEFFGDYFQMSLFTYAYPTLSWEFQPQACLPLDGGIITQTFAKFLADTCCFPTAAPTTG